MGGGKGGGSQTVGYKYLLGLQAELCHGPIDFVSRFDVDSRTAWQGAMGDGQIEVAADNLFGGDGREGGVSGAIDICLGKPTQGKNDYLLSRIGSAISAYRGVVTAVFRQFYFGNNPYLKPYSFRGTRIHVRQDGIPQWYDGKAGIPSVDTLSIISTTTVNIPGTHMYDPANRVTIAADPSEYVMLTKPTVAASGGALTWDAYSAWPSDGYTGTGPPPVIGQTWQNWVSVYGNNGGADTLLWSAPLSNTNYGTIADAQAALAALMPQYFTGYSTYTIVGGADPAPTDNRGGLSLFAQVAVGTGNDLNPAHIIRECLTDPIWGMGYTDDDIDDPSFTYAADTFFNEGLGMSLLWDKETKIEDFVNLVLQHVEAALYVSRSTGKFVLKPIRADYDEGALLHLDESNIVSVDNPSRVAYGELTNQVTVTYWEALTGKDSTVSVNDPALVQQQGAIIDAPVQYPGFTNVRNATIAAQRDLRSLSAPLLACTITAESDAKVLNIGDTFKFSWAKWGIVDYIMRVNGIAYGTGRNNRVKINCSQDVFDTDTATIVVSTSTGWVDPSGPPSAVTEQIAVEAPYYEIVQRLGQDATDYKLNNANDAGYVVAAGSQPSGAINATLYTDSGSGYASAGHLDFCPAGALATDLTKTQTTFVLSNGSNFDLVTLGTHFQIGNELMRVDTLDHTTGAITVGRGVLDTVPQYHTAGDIAYFWDTFSGYDNTEYVAGETVDAKIVTQSGSGVLPIADADAMPVTLAQRAWLPYPPGDLRINGDSYIENASYLGVVTISWKHRDRLLQTSGTLQDHTAGDIGPEAGTTYRFRGYIDGTLVHTEDDIAGNSTTWTPEGSGLCKVEIHSKRDGVYSLYAPSHTFENSTSMLTEEGDARYTEDGDVRVIEG